MTEIIVTARWWERGWELLISDEDATQTSTLADAEQQVRDYLDTLEPESDHGDVKVTIVPELGELGADVRAARDAAETAARAAREAAARSREAVRHLRAAGLSVADSALIMGVSRRRVCELEDL